MTISEISALLAIPRSPQWPAIEKAHLAKEPRCIACGTDKMLTVHHLIPFSWDRSRELDPTNLATLCESPSHNCHEIFGHLLNWSSYNANCRADAEGYRKKVETRPMHAASMEDLIP